MADGKPDEKPKETIDTSAGHSSSGTVIVVSNDDVKKLHHRSFLDTVNLGYLGAAMATLFTAWQSVNNYFYKNELDEGEHEIAKSRRLGDLKKLNDEKLGEGTGEEVLATAHGMKESWMHMRNTDAIERGFRKAINNKKFKGQDFLDDSFLPKNYEEFSIGFRNFKLENLSKNIIEGADDMFRGTAQRFMELKSHQRGEVMGRVFVVLTVAAGAIFSFSRERRLAEKLERQEAKNEDLKRDQRVH